MPHLTEAASPPLVHCYTPEEIVLGLPHEAYGKTYQPTYSDASTLIQSLTELASIEPVVTPETVRELRTTLGRIALGEDARPVIITGRCAAPVDYTDTATLAVATVATDRFVHDIFPGGVLHISRDTNHTKPRSAAYEPDGRSSYMGDDINGANERTPDPYRMVTAARHDVALVRAVDERVSTHVPIAREALLLASTMSNIYVAEDGQYLLSAGLPWIGARTCSAEGPHVALLQHVENAVGIKVSGSSTPEHIIALASMLNPNHIVGKPVFMIRVSDSETEKLQPILCAVREYAPNSVVLYDIHGSTKTNAYGEKIRSVVCIQQQIQRLGEACIAAGLRLHGLHLETIAETERRECVEEDDERPPQKGGIDPQLNPKQLRTVLTFYRDKIMV